MIDQEHRLAVIGLIAMVLFGALVTRLGYLQTVQARGLRDRTEAIATDRVLVPTIRGRILDRNGVVLVDNLPARKPRRPRAWVRGQDQPARDRPRAR